MEDGGKEDGGKEEGEPAPPNDFPGAVDDAGIVIEK
jgi:hypothetical protein